MRIEQLIHFVEISEAQSITKAAKKLFIAQPSLSSSLNNLEAELGTKLLDRSKQGVELTSKGEEILKIAKNILDDIERIRITASDQEVKKETIHICVVPSAYNAFLLDLTIFFKTKYPHVEIIVHEKRPRDIPDMIATGEAQLGITQYYEATEAEEIESYLVSRKLKQKILFNDKLTLFVSKKHPLLKQEKVMLREVKRYPFVSYHKINAEKILLENKYQKTILDLPENTYCVKTREAIQQVVMKSDAVALLPKLHMINDLYSEQGLIVPVEIEDLEIRSLFSVLYSSQRELSTYEQEIIEFFINQTIHEIYPKLNTPWRAQVD